MMLANEAFKRFMAIEPDVHVNLLPLPKATTDVLALIHNKFLETHSSEIDLVPVDVIWPGDLADHLVDLYQHG